MRILIFGSTGSIGKLLVQQALEENHHVTAFVRNPMAISIRHPNLSVIRGDVIDRTSVERATPGHDAVICTLGAGSKGMVRAVGTQNRAPVLERPLGRWRVTATSSRRFRTRASGRDSLYIECSTWPDGSQPNCLTMAIPRAPGLKTRRDDESVVVTT